MCGLFVLLFGLVLSAMLKQEYCQSSPFRLRDRVSHQLILGRIKCGHCSWILEPIARTTHD